MLGFFAVKMVGILMAVFAGNYTVFVIGRFLIGGGQVGYFLPGFVLGIVSQPIPCLFIHVTRLYCYIVACFVKRRDCLSPQKIRLDAVLIGLQEILVLTNS